MRMVISFLAIPLLGIFFESITASSSLARAEDADVIQRFRDEYPTASQKLQSFYTNLKMVGRETKPRHIGHPRNGNLQVQTTDWEFLGNGTSLRVVVSRQNAPPAQREVLSSVLVADPELSFVLRKYEGATRYTVEDMWSETQPQEYQQTVQWAWRTVTAAHAPFAVISTPVEEKLLRESFTLVGGRELDGPEGQGKLIRIDWEDLNPDGPARLRGWYLFNPNAAWALQAYEVVYLGMPTSNRETGEVGKEDFTRHGVMEYQGEIDGIPLLRKVRTWGSGQEYKTPETVDEVTTLTPGPAPEAEFTLAAFGIETSPAAEPIPLMYYLLALSLLCVLLMFLFRYFQTRTANADASA